MVWPVTNEVDSDANSLTKDAVSAYVCHSLQWSVFNHLSELRFSINLAHQRGVDETETKAIDAYLWSKFQRHALGEHVEAGLSMNNSLAAFTLPENVVFRGRC